LPDRPRPTVLFVGAFPPPGRTVFGGMVTSCRTLVESSLAQRVVFDRFDTTMLRVPEPPFAVRAAAAGARLVRYAWRLLRHRPDAVLLFAAVGLSFLEKGVMAWMARAVGIPSLLFPRGGGVVDDAARSPRARRWYAWAAAGASRVLCQAPTWQRFVVDTLGVPASRAPLVPNWTAAPALVALRATREVRAPDAPVRLLFLGWLDREKGVVDLLDACGQLLARGVTGFSLAMGGEGNLTADAPALIAARGLTGRVTLCGWLRGAALDDALRAADVLVLPSWVEGLPNAMIEAMAAGLAVVVTAVGMVPDVVTSGEDALVVPPRDPAALATALEHIIRDSALRSRIADRGHALAVRQFGLDAAVTRLSAVLSDVLQRPV
jgi:glycosyltransferase involved in cell wall biosynthesis